MHGSDAPERKAGTGTPGAALANSYLLSLDDATGGVTVYRHVSVVARGAVCAAALGALVLALSIVPPAGASGGSGASKALGWGYDFYGQLGDGNSGGGTSVPVRVKLPKGIQLTSVTAGLSHTLAVTSTGSLLAWGDNAFGALGDHDAVPQSDVPIKVKLTKGTKVTAVSAGQHDSVALTSSGSLLAWGENSRGQLGNGHSGGAKTVPVKVKLPRGAKVTAVSTGRDHTLAVTSTGAVLAWGYNLNGELGDGKIKNRDVPVKVKLPRHTKAVAVAAGCDHSLALTSAGRVLAWGLNLDGELGDGQMNDGSHVPVKVKLPRHTKVVALAAGCDHSLALTSSGAVLAWGYGHSGQLGNGLDNSEDVPVKVQLPTGTKATAIGGIEFSSAALTSKGAVLTWGDDSDGQLGVGGMNPSSMPVQVQLPAGIRASKLGTGPNADDMLALVHRA